MNKLFYDLHIHSCLSPCGDDDSLPSNIVGMSVLKGLNVIAVTDHNSCKNCPAVMKLAEQYGIIAIPGMELTTAEEVHVVCLFEELDGAVRFSNYVSEHILPIENDENIFGKQQICDENDNIIGTEKNLLINATDIFFDYTYDIVKDFGGVIIPAHIDKSTTSLLSNLGFIPPDSKFTCVEIKHTGFIDNLKSKHPYLNNVRILTNSDAHYLENISEPVNFLETNVKDIKNILKYITEVNNDFK